MNTFLFIDSPKGYSPETLVIEIPKNINSKAKLLEALALQLNFPSYFGRNWDALEECLGDLSWLNAEKVILWHNHIPLLSTRKELQTYLRILVDSMKANASVAIEIVFPTKCRSRVKRLLEGL